MALEEKKQQVKILIVDDDKFLLDMYLMKFKSQGLVAETCAGSALALAKLREGEKYDIILLDIIMPGIDGLELLQMIRKDKLAESSVIIMLTNQADEIEHAESLGVDGYIIKATSIPSEVIQKVLDIYNTKHKK